MHKRFYAQNRDSVITRQTCRFFGQTWMLGRLEACFNKNMNDEPRREALLEILYNKFATTLLTGLLVQGMFFKA